MFKKDTSRAQRSGDCTHSEPRFMHMKIRFCIYELSPKTMAEISVGMCFFLNHFCNGDSLLVLGFDKKSDSQGLGKNMRTVTLLYHRLWFLRLQMEQRDCLTVAATGFWVPNFPTRLQSSLILLIFGAVLENHIFQKDLYTLEISTILKSLSTSCCLFLCFFQIKSLWYLYRILNFSFVSQMEIIMEVCFRTVPPSFSWKVAK